MPAIAESGSNRESRFWHDGGVRHLRFGDRDLKVCQFREGERLTALEYYVRIPRKAIQGGVRLLARLGVDGSGLHTVPKNGDFLELSWDPGAFLPDEADGAMIVDAWRNVEANAIAPSEPEIWNTGEACVVRRPGEWVPEIDVGIDLGPWRER